MSKTYNNKEFDWMNFRRAELENDIRILNLAKQDSTTSKEALQISSMIFKLQAALDSIISQEATFKRQKEQIVESNNR